jgi:hypothetical protein
VVLITFFYEKLKDENFHEGIDLCLKMRRNVDGFQRLRHLKSQNTSEGSVREENYFDVSSNKQFVGYLKQWDVWKCGEYVEDVSGVKNFQGDLGRWDVGKVADFSSLFSGASKVNGGGSYVRSSRSISWRVDGVFPQ